MGAIGRAFLVAMAVSFAMPAAADEAAAWAALRGGGHVVLIRHASTQPGLGDPPGYRLDDCATQRNLSVEGRAEARRIGERFRREGVAVAKVYSSPWCRCRDTAREAFGDSEAWDALASFFDRREREPQQTAAVRERIAGYAKRPPKGNVVMVTHQVNISALTGRGVGMGEVVVLKPGAASGFDVVGQLRIP